MIYKRTKTGEYVVSTELFEGETELSETEFLAATELRLRPETVEEAQAKFDEAEACKTAMDQIKAAGHNSIEEAVLHLINQAGGA